MATDIQLHKQQAQELSNKLWAIANDLRGTMDASKFKDYILGIIFYRFLSLLNHTSPANTRKRRASLTSRTQAIVLVPPLDRD